MRDSTQMNDETTGRTNETSTESVNRRLDLLISLSSWFPKNNIDVSLS